MRLLLVDDHEMVRGAFSRLLDSQPDIEVVGEASTFEQAVHQARLLRPDVMTMDLDLPDQTGCEAVLRMVREPDSPAVVICSYRAHPAEVEMLMQAGVKGYVTKSSPAGELVHAVRSVGNGQTYFCARSLNALKEARESCLSGVSRTLTPRQMDVLQLAAKGYSTRAIGQTLGLSAKTVENYRSAILRRLDARNLAHAVTVARSMKLLND
jgi:NarL family two-component system response regulator LiaR